MAYEIGSASGFSDLRTKLITFLTTNPELVSLGQQWSVAWTGSGRVAEHWHEDIVLSGPGLAGTDQVYVGLRSLPQPNSDRYNLALRGVVGVNPAALTYDQHVNVSGSTTMCCADFEMPYWFIANGRRFIVVIKVSTVYQSMYGGLMLPYAPPNIYPYPLVVGGCTVNETARWSDTGNGMHHFPDPGTDGAVKLFQYDNSWKSVINWVGSYRRYSEYSIAPWNPGYPDGYEGTSYSAFDSYRNTFISKIQTDSDGCYPLTPATIQKSSDPTALLGTLQGVYHVPGFNLSAETILNQNGVQFLCIPDVYREGNDFYAAYALDED